MEAPEVHSRFSPSASSRWMECPGSLVLIERMTDYSKQPDGPLPSYIQEGLDAHLIASEAFQLDCDASATPAGQGKPLEMRRIANQYVKYVKKHQTEDSQLMVETRVNYTEDVFGTADAIVMDFKRGILHVFDLKYGRGTFVPVEKNKQLMIYALGVLETFDLFEELQRIHLHIYQPRAGNKNRWQVSREDLIIFGLQVEQIVNRIKNDPDNQQLNPGETQCRFCPIKPVCPAQEEMMNQVIGEEFENIEEKPENMNLKKIQQVLDHAKQIRAYLSAVEAYATSTISKGGKVPGHKLVETKSRSKWRPGVEFILKKKFGTKVLRYDLITITDAKQLLGTAWDKNWIYRPPGKPVLVPESDPRPALEEFINLDEEGVE